MRNGWCKSPPERAPATIAQRQGCSNGGAWALGTDWRRRRARSSVPSYTGRSAGFQMIRTLRLRGTTCTLCADYFCRSFLSATFIASAVVTFDLRPWGEFGWGLLATRLAGDLRYSWHKGRVRRELRRQAFRRSERDTFLSCAD